jgi:peptide chain release factor 2
VTLEERELRIDTYRGSGPGGQHRNKTDSAVRVTHQSTGLVASCEQGRSQELNKRTALALLRSRLHEHRQAQREHELDRVRDKTVQAGFGARIRSYVLTPFQLITDHRTGVQRTDVEAVLAGDLDELIGAQLRDQARI